MAQPAAGGGDGGAQTAPEGDRPAHAGAIVML
jgi:hypothetical protein